jgi:DNA-binding PadR family transcriptional regulator
VLVLLAEEPMHGYQLMRTIADRTDGRWQPSPGAIYPTISQLEDEGLITVTSSSGRRLAALTDAGREHLAGNMEAPNPFASFDSAEEYVDLRGQLDKLHAAVRLIGQTGTEAQRAAAQQIITEARRSLYRLLADDVDTDSG